MKLVINFNRDQSGLENLDIVLEGHHLSIPSVGAAHVFGIAKMEETVVEEVLKKPKRECCGSMSFRHKAGCINSEKGLRLPEPYECDSCSNVFEALRGKQKTCPNCKSSEVYKIPTV